MGLPRILPEFSDAKVAPKGKLNAEDVQKMINNALLFFRAPILLYLGQLMFLLDDLKVLGWSDLAPSVAVIGGFQVYLISVAIDYLKKLNDGQEK